MPLRQSLPTFMEIVAADSEYLLVITNPHG